MKNGLTTFPPFLLLILLLSFPVFGQNDLGFTTTQKPLFLHQTKIMVRIHETSKAKSPITFVSLHHTEQLSLGIALEAIKKNGGKLVEIVSLDSNDKVRRYLHFKYDDHELCVDPNRIFSRLGIETSLGEIRSSWEAGCTNNSDSTEKYNTDINVYKAIDKFKRDLIALCKPIAPNGALVAVHNNKLDGSITFDSFMVQNDDEFKNTQTYYLAPDDQGNSAIAKENRRDFFMVSNRTLYKKLHSSADKSIFSVALQRQMPDTNRGYLSTYCSWNKIPYAIVEAGHKISGGTDHRERQTAMIDRLIKLFPSTKVR